MIGTVCGKHAFLLSEPNEAVTVHTRFGVSFEGLSMVEEWAGMPFENDGEEESPATGANPALVVQKKSCHGRNPRVPLMPYV